VDLSDLPARSGEKVFFGALTIVVCVDFVLGKMLHVACYGQYGGKPGQLCQVRYVYSG
jgi:hypothetical protein